MSKVNLLISPQNRGPKTTVQIWNFRLGLLLVAGLSTACARSAYPAPKARPIVPNEPEQGFGYDPGDVERIQQMESRCRVRLRGETAKASLAALDRVHQVLGTNCDIETVDHDPMHWLLHCRSDALFESGKFQLTSSKQSCAELNHTSVNPWVCVGAVLQNLTGLSSGSAVKRLAVAVVGHVDMQPINPKSDSHLCTELQEYFEYRPDPAWVEVSAEAEDEERQRANDQLAWCRAASVSKQIRIGMERAHTSKRKQEVDLAILGLSKSWLLSQPGGVCPNHGKSWQERKDCTDARRVDLLVRFEPRSETALSHCDKKGKDPTTRLYCLQQCSEQAAVGSRVGSGMSSETAPLFLERSSGKRALKAGWYLKLLTQKSNRYLDIHRVCDTLNIQLNSQP